MDKEKARVAETTDEDPRYDTEKYDDGHIPQRFYGPTQKTGERRARQILQSNESDDGLADSNRVFVDFDNTLTKDNVRYWEGERPEPDEEVIETVRECYHSGYTVVIWTARPWSEANQIAAHCTEWGVKYHGIRCNKGSGDVYIDDCAVRPQEAVDGYHEQVMGDD